MRVDNQEQPFHPIYNYAFITDRVEGLIATDVNTLVDNEPRNNFLERALTWNEGGVLDGARHLTIAGTYFYVAADAGPRRARHGPAAGAQAGHGAAAHRTCARPRSSSATCSRSTARGSRSSTSPTPSGRGWSRAPPCRSPTRTGSTSRAPTPTSRPAAEGLVIVDVERPEAPALYTRFTADGHAERRAAT